MSSASQFYPILRLHNFVMLLKKKLKNSEKTLTKHSLQMQTIFNDGL